MGNTSSSELDRVPLRPQPKPFRLSELSVVVSSLKTLRIKIPTLRSTIQVFDAQTSELLYEIKSATLGSRVTLFKSSGEALFSIKGKTFSDGYRVYEGTEKNHETVAIHAKDPVLSPLVVFAEIEDKVSRGNCRVLAEGGYSDAVTLIYLERGWPNLSKLEKRDNGGHPQYEPVGRVRRLRPGHEELLEVAPGVDETLMLLVWFVRYQIEKNDASMMAVIVS